MMERAFYRAFNHTVDARWYKDRNEDAATRRFREEGSIPEDGTSEIDRAIANRLSFINVPYVRTKDATR